MNLQKLFAVLLALSLFPSGLRGQSRFIKEGAWGGELSLSGSTAQGYSGLTANAGFSLNGVIDAALAYNSTRFPDHQSLTAQTAHYWEPSFTFHFFKQRSGGSPVSIAVGLGYHALVYKSGVSDGSSLRLNENFYEFSYSMYRDILIDETLSLQPMLKVTGFTGDTQTGIEPALAAALPSSLTTVLTYTYELGVACIWRDSATSGFFVEPMISGFETATMIGVAVGMFR